MSGHSKWSQIKRQKGAADVKRGASFSKLTNAIIVAAKGGGDVNTNFTLKMAVEKAKQENMPKDTIERAIKRGTGETAGAAIEEHLYEIIAQGGVGIILEIMSDNKNRSASEIKNILNKMGGKLASSGAVTYQFTKMGKLIVAGKDKNHEDLELQMIDAGVEDFFEEGDDIAAFTKPNELEITKKALESDGLEIKEAVLTYEPQSLMTVQEDQKAKIIKLLEALENLDDAVAVHTNLEV